ncbi:hypothetical protein [Streptomyces sp. DSM 118878]
MTERGSGPGSRPGGPGPDYASKSLPEHILRGVVGFGALAGSVALIPVVGLVSLVLLPVGLLSFRGCPTCWAVGLMQTISRGRLQRSCENGRCGLTTAAHGTHRRDSGGSEASRDSGGTRGGGPGLPTATP